MKAFRASAAALVIGGACVLSAQTTPPAVNSLSFEAPLPFGQIGAATTPNIPANILQSIVGGALRVRQIVNLRNDGLLRIQHVLVQSGAAVPAPENARVAVLEDYLVRVNSTLAGSTPSTLTYIGTVEREQASSPFGMSTGSPVILSFGYQTGTPARFGNITLLVPGRLTTYIQSGGGTFGIGDDGVTPPPDGGVTVGIAESITTVQPEIVLDPMATDPRNRALSYSWRVVSGPGTILSPTSAQTRVQLPRLATPTVFELTVTPGGGTPTSKRITVTYIGAPF